MGEYQERPKRSSSNNNKNLPPIQAYEQYMYGGGFPEADRSPLPITPELVEQLEKEDEELFLRFGSKQAYNKPKKKEIPLKSTEATQLSGDKQDSLSKNKTSISVEKQDKAIFEQRDKATSNEKQDIAGFSQAEKLLSVLNLTIQKLPSALGSQLKALINPASIAVMAGVLGTYAASHAVGVGFIADAVMGVSAGLFLGWQAIDVAKDLWAFAQYVNATTEADLDKAADHLAKAISTVGFDVILGILTKKAAGKVSQHVDDLKQVDVVHAHSDSANNINTGNLDDAGENVSKQIPNIIDHDGIQAKQNIMERMDEIAPRSDDIIKEAVESGNIPARAQNRINIRAGSATLSNRYRGSGLNYALSNHLNPSKAGTKSQFSISKNEIISILSDENVIQSPVAVGNTTSARAGGLTFVREVDLAQFGHEAIGNYPTTSSHQGAATTKITIITDGFGNLKNVFPGYLNDLNRS